MPEEVKVPYHERFIPKYNEVRQQLLDNGYDSFVHSTEFFYREFTLKDGTVTCEGSTMGSHLDLKLKFLSLMSMIDPTSIGHWRMYWCETCESHSKEHPYHHELVRNKKD